MKAVGGDVRAMIIVDSSEAMALFDLLPIDKQKNILKSAVRKALIPILNEAKQNFQAKFNQNSGKGLESLGIQMMRDRIGGAVGSRIISKAGEMKKYRLAKASGGESHVIQKYGGYYGRFLDSGTNERFTKKGKSNGILTKSDFFTSVTESRVNSATEDLTNGVIFALNSAINRGKIT